VIPTLQVIQYNLTNFCDTAFLMSSTSVMQGLISAMVSYRWCHMYKHVIFFSSKQKLSSV